MFMQEIAFSSFNVEEVMPPGGSRTKTVGKDAPGVALAGVDGRKTDIKDLRGKTLLLYVWATWCVPCRDTSTIVKIVYQDTGFSDKTEASLTAALKEQGFD
jgi:thiol-disulfide isomerase/thioredoxin